MKDGLVSIVMPCWNAQRFIAETITSVLSQTWNHWELLLVDDGSTDNTPQIVADFAEKDRRIRVLRQENAGSAAARNLGIRNAEGRYLALLDADDLWHPQFLEKQIACLREHQAVCAACAYELIDETSRSSGKIIYPPQTITYRAMTVRNRIGCLSALYDMKKYGKRYLREDLNSIRDDYAFWLDIVALEGTAIGNQAVLAGYRVTKNSTTGNKTKLIARQYDFYRKYLGQPFFTAVKNLLAWGISGVFKFYIR